VKSTPGVNFILVFGTAFLHQSSLSVLTVCACIFYPKDGYQRYCDINTETSVLKSVTIGEGGVKFFLNIASFMDDPKGNL